MKRFLLACASMFFLYASQATAADQYDPVPAKGLKQYTQCIGHVNEAYEGGNAKSPIAGQTKAEAYCTCMWSESDEDFNGNLVKFGQTAQGKKINNMCEKYSNWRE